MRAAVALASLRTIPLRRWLWGADGKVFRRPLAEPRPCGFSLGRGCAKPPVGSPSAPLAVGPASRHKRPGATQPADKDRGLAGKATAFPAALLGFNPSQFCSCRRVADCSQPATPTCRCSPRTRLDGLVEGPTADDVKKRALLAAVGRGKRRTGFWVLAPPASSHLRGRAATEGRYCLGLGLSQA